MMEGRRGGGDDVDGVYGAKMNARKRNRWNGK